MQKTDYIWFNGKQTPWDQAQVHVLTHALHYGSAVFEGIRAYSCADGSSAVFRLEEHIARLLNSCKIMTFKHSFTQTELVNAVIDTLKINKLKEGYIRPLMFVGFNEMGVYPGNNPVHAIVAVWPWGAYLGEEALEHGIRVKTSSFARMHVNTFMSKAKTAGNYINSILAKIEVKQDGYDEAIMLDTQGYVSEATGENLFIVRNGIIKTPPLTSVLEGITRDSLVRVARDLGYTVEEQMFTRDELYIADEAFFTGTAAELTPIREVDNRQIGQGHAGPITKHLQQEFFRAVKGENAKWASWLTHYNI